MNKIQELLQQAYDNMTSDNFEFDFVLGLIAHAKAVAEGDYSSFDNEEDINAKT